MRFLYCQGVFKFSAALLLVTLTTARGISQEALFSLSSIPALLSQKIVLKSIPTPDLLESNNGT